MNQDLVEQYPKFQDMSNESINKSIECQESLIQEMIKLYSDETSRQRNERRFSPRCLSEYRFCL